MSSVTSKFAKRTDDFSVTICDNGYYADFGGRDEDDNWYNQKFIFKDFNELVDAIVAYESLPRA